MSIIRSYSYYILSYINTFILYLKAWFTSCCINKWYIRYIDNKHFLVVTWVNNYLNSLVFCSLHSCSPCKCIIDRLEFFISSYIKLWLISYSITYTYWCKICLLDFLAINSCCYTFDIKISIFFYYILCSFNISSTSTITYYWFLTIDRECCTIAVTYIDNLAFFNREVNLSICKCKKIYLVFHNRTC